MQEVDRLRTDSWNYRLWESYSNLDNDGNYYNDGDYWYIQNYNACPMCQAHQIDSDNEHPSLEMSIKMEESLIHPDRELRSLEICRCFLCQVWWIRIDPSKSK